MSLFYYILSLIPLSPSAKAMKTETSSKFILIGTLILCFQLVKKWGRMNQDKPQKCFMLFVNSLFVIFASLYRPPSGNKQVFSDTLQE